ncbi:MAG: hypothetical protein J5601_03555 [Elusimicrobiaceae bacterium]|nr:hypothetical protein [Elusimicrobiaceae bacterium]
MKKYIIYTFFLSMLTACAGNPPTWWNPSGRYSTTTPSSSSAPSIQTEIPDNSVSTPQQETLLPLDTDYEEMALSPIAAEEDTSTPTDLEPSVLEE